MNIGAYHYSPPPLHLRETVESAAGIIPTMEKQLDTYFDRHFDLIIEEFGLLTAHDLRDIDLRLQKARDSVDMITGMKTRLDERIRSLEQKIAELEGTV